MKRLLMGAILLLGVAGPVQAGARDYFSEFVKDFGTTPRGPVLTHYFTIKNTTGQTVQIGHPRVSCGCVSAQVLKQSLSPGESTALLALMDTRRIPQSNVVKAVTVYIPFLSPALEEVSVTVQAIARDDLVMTPDMLAFGTLRKGQGGSASVKVTFYSDPSWEVKEVTSTGGYIKPEAQLVSRAGSAVTYEIAANLDPACPVGDWTADIWLKTSSAAVEKLRIPVRVTVVAPIALNPDVVKLPELRIGDSIEHKVILRGNQAFKVLEVKGGDEVVKLKPQSDDAKPVHVLTISVHPTEAGVLSRTFEIVTDHKEQEKVSLPFRATVMQK